MTPFPHVRSLLGALMLLGIAMTALPADEKAAPKLPADLALMPATPAAFVSFQPGPLLRHPLANVLAVLEGDSKRQTLEKDLLLGVAPGDIERATVFFPNLAEAAVIVRTRKPYDRT